MGVSVSTQVSFRNLMDTVTNLCDAADVGIKTAFDPVAKLFTVQLYAGSASQSIFSKEYENIMEQIFTKSLLSFANTALVGGEGEGVERTFVTTGGGVGIDRYEIFVDAKDLRLEDFPDDYEAALLFRGNTKLAEQAMIQAFDVIVNQYSNLTYKLDFDLGNMIQVAYQSSLLQKKKFEIHAPSAIINIPPRYKTIIVNKRWLAIVIERFCKRTLKSILKTLIIIIIIAPDPIAKPKNAEICLDTPKINSKVYSKAERQHP